LAAVDLEVVVAPGGHRGIHPGVERGGVGGLAEIEVAHRDAEVGPGPFGQGGGGEAERGGQSQRDGLEHLLHD
jgi:hypothetical protein